MSVLGLIALAAGQYFAPPFQVTLLVVYNTSYSVALYGLLMFYKATRPLLTPFKPVQKFFAVKSVIFATYWQSVVVHFIPGLSSEQSLLWNDWLLCMELVAFALILNSAFPWHDFIMEQRDKPVMENVREMLSVRDVFQDAYHSFMPSYQDYVVARDDIDPNTNPDEARAAAAAAAANNGKQSRVVRTRTFLIGNLDRGNMNNSNRTNPSPSQEGHEAGQSGSKGVSQDLEGGHQERNGRTRHAPPGGLQEEDEDMEGGLDEDWGQDVDIIELQNRLPDYDKSKNRGPGMQSGGEGGWSAGGGGGELDEALWS
eukprot:jgi/Undpi1/9149/HiC_scaffold_26.g11607.m1